MRRRVTISIAVAFVVALLPGTVHAVTADAPYAAADAAMRTRVTSDQLDGGALVAMREGTVLHQATFGNWPRRAPFPIASASKWLTSATLMTFVDAGRIDLDDPVARYLPAFDGPKSHITVRQLLSHTSGLVTSSCEGDPSTTLAACARAIAKGPEPVAAPGSQFHYSGVGYVVAARIVELLNRSSFEQAFEQRIAKPLRMTHTRFDGTSPPHTRNPAPAASARSTVDDYARFLAMLANDGAAAGRQILQPDSVAEIERDQVAGIDTTDDGAVRITGIPTYGLGVWRDVVGADDAIEVVSGSGALGFYPWIDRVHGTYGIVAVDDEVHGPEHAVPASQRIARLVWSAAS